MMATDQYAEFRAISDRLWQVPTGIDGQHRFLFIVKAWWQSDPQMVVMIVQAINTFTRPDAKFGDFACYIACPPGDSGIDRYQQAKWTVEHGCKLSGNEQSGFAFPEAAPDGVALDWRP